MCKASHTEKSVKASLNERFTPIALEMSERGLVEYASIFARNDSPRDMDILRWRYSKHGSSGSHVYIACEQGAHAKPTAALYAISGVKFKVFGHIVTAAQSLDTLTDKDYRRLGLFGWLGAITYRAAQDKGVRLVYGFPNAYSGPGFEKQLNWKLFGPVPFLVKPLRSGYFLKQVAKKLWLSGRVVDWLDFRLTLMFRTRNKLPAEIKIRPLARFESDYDRVWSKFSSKVNICVDRDSTYMNWRIFDRPGDGYMVNGAYKGDELLGIVIWHVRHRHGGKIGYLMDLICNPDDKQICSLLLNSAISEIIDVNADAILAWQLPHSPGAGALKSAGFFNLPDRFRPIKLSWGATDLQDSEKTQLSNPADWYISYLDSDTV